MNQISQNSTAATSTSTAPATTAAPTGATPPENKAAKTTVNKAEAAQQKADKKKAAADKKKAAEKKKAEKAARAAAPKPVPMPKVAAASIEKGVKIADIIADESKMQAREKLSEKQAKLYATLMKEGTKFPPIECFVEDGKFVLADGFHRLHALKANGEITTTVKVREGGERAAQFYALGANSAHGLSRTNADKKKAVHELLADSEWSLYSDRDLARFVGVSNVMVSKYRKSLKRNSGEGEGEGADSGKGSKGGRLRAELTEQEQKNLDDSLAAIKVLMVKAAKAIESKNDPDFLRRLFNAEFKALVADTKMGVIPKDPKKREINPAHAAKKAEKEAKA